MGHYGEKTRKANSARLKSFSPPGDIHARSPVNKMAAVVTGVGVSYCPDKRGCKGLLHSAGPIEMRPITASERCNPTFVDCTGRAVGRLRCVGMIDPRTGYYGWLMRCACGRYTNRRQKAILNPCNKSDCCQECQQLLYLKRNQVWREHGRNVATEDLPK